MRVLVFEFVTGGGFVQLPGSPLPEGSLLHEGQAMAQAIVHDFSRLPVDPADLVVLRDSRLRSTVNWPGCSFRDIDGVDALHRELSWPSDVALVIAPESDGLLLVSCQRVRPATKLLLNGTDEFIAWTSSKHNTALRLARHSVPCPAGQLLCGGEQPRSRNLPFPLVAKPDDGCGSQSVSVVEDHDQLRRTISGIQSSWRVEQLIRGRSASVAALCGGSGVLWLTPCWQLLDPSSLAYVGGQLIEEAAFKQRALRLVRRVEPLLRDAAGYVGVDVMLGAPDDGSADFVIELNPRLTMSYVCLRRAYATNLVQAMIHSAEGQELQLDLAEDDAMS